MSKDSLILIFDVGKTNKKLFVFNDQYRIVHQEEQRISEIQDEDGDPCEDLNTLTNWVRNSFDELIRRHSQIKAVNFASYGASFVHINDNGKPATPLYNYLKPFPEELHDKFYKEYGGVEQFCLDTASPDLGNLNSGLQLYLIKNQKPERFQKIKYSLHLPQYLSWLITGSRYSDITSIGCHTGLWNFKLGEYHRWVKSENIIGTLAEIFPANGTIAIENSKVISGVGLHDSSAALIPYLASFAEPFVLISTGTWCISLNPFNQSELTIEELADDCLCYLDYKGNSVKASRLFAGHEHENAVKLIASHFDLQHDFYRLIRFNKEISNKLKTGQKLESKAFSVFDESGLDQYADHVDAYYDFMAGLIRRQVKSTNLILKGSNVRDIFVDGGFSNNPIYMHLLAEAYPDYKVWAATVAQSTALGAALSIHSAWNKNELLPGLVEKQLFKPEKEISKI